MADVHTPFPVHGMDEALGLRRTRLALATLVGGLLGRAWQASASSSGSHVGRLAADHRREAATLALPAQVPVTLRADVLVAAFATLGTFLARRRLFPRMRP